MTLVSLDSYCSFLESNFYHFYPINVQRPTPSKQCKILFKSLCTRFYLYSFTTVEGTSLSWSLIRVSLFLFSSPDERGPVCRSLEVRRESFIPYLMYWRKIWHQIVSSFRVMLILLGRILNESSLSSCTWYVLFWCHFIYFHAHKEVHARKEVGKIQ